jgi:Holliday junction resolvase
MKNRLYASEEKFKKLLDQEQIPYLDIRQDKGQLPVFLKEGGKRVDFVVFLKGNGILAFDAKERNNSEDTFDIHEEDALKLREFEALTGVHTYVVFMYAPKTGGKQTAPMWYFIDTYRLTHPKAAWRKAGKKVWKVERSCCSKTQDIQIAFFKNYLNKNSEYVIVRNPRIKNPKGGS